MLTQVPTVAASGAEGYLEVATVRYHAPVINRASARSATYRGRRMRWILAELQRASMTFAKNPREEPQSRTFFKDFGDDAFAERTTRLAPSAFAEAMADPPKPWRRRARTAWEKHRAAVDLSMPAPALPIRTPYMNRLG